VGPISDELTRAGKRFAWTGISLPDRLISVLQCRMQAAGAAELESNPLGGACEIDAGDITLFIEGSVDDRLIEDLLFAFLELDWASFEMTRPPSRAGVLPTYAVLKCLFLPGKVRRGDEPKSLLADRRILSLLNAGATERATDVATHRLRIAGFRPLRVTYSEGIEPRRLAASLLIPVQQGNLLNCGIFLKEESTAYA
jgi:CRISPR-associated protein Csx17